MENLAIVGFFFAELCYRFTKLPVTFLEFLEKTINTILNYINILLQEINKTGEFTFSFKISRTKIPLSEPQPTTPPTTEE